MKFCYADESGHKAQNVVVAGIVVDAVRMRPTKAIWKELLIHLSTTHGGNLREIKSGDMHRGNGWWRRFNGDERAGIIESIIEWMNDRRHEVSFGAVCRDRLLRARRQRECDGFEKNNEWTIAAMHLVLGIQKRHQTIAKNKGHTVFVFDHGVDAAALQNLVLRPPSAMDGVYARKAKEQPLSQVVDVPFFADSQHAILIQIADFYAYILRLYADLEDGMHCEKYAGEGDRVRGWVEKMRPVLMPGRFRWPQGTTDRCAQFLREIAPPALLDLG